MQPGERQVLLRFPAGRRKTRMPAALASRTPEASRTVLPMPGSPRITSTWLSANGGVTSPVSRDDSFPPPDQARVRAGRRACASVHPVNIGTVIRHLGIGARLTCCGGGLVIFLLNSTGIAAVIRGQVQREVRR